MWALLIVALYGNSVAMTTIGYNTEQECNDAINVLKTKGIVINGSTRTAEITVWCIARAKR